VLTQKLAVVKASGGLPNGVGSGESLGTDAEALKPKTPPAVVGSLMQGHFPDLTRALSSEGIVPILMFVTRFQRPEEVQLRAFGSIQLGKGLVEDETRESVS